MPTPVPATVKRYDLYNEYDVPTRSGEDPEGEWVKWEDYEAERLAGTHWYAEFLKMQDKYNDLVEFYDHRPDS